MPEQTTKTEPVVLWHRRTRRLLTIGGLSLLNGGLVVAMYPTAQGLAWALVAFAACMGLGFALGPLTAADHPVFRADADGIWIKGVTEQPVPWSTIRAVRPGVIYEANRTIDFDMAEGPARDALLAARGGKQAESSSGKCDFLFVVPIGENPKLLLDRIVGVMKEARLR